MLRGNDVLPAQLGRFLGERHCNESSAWQSRVSIANTEAICDAVAAFQLDIGLIEGPCHQPTLAITPWLEDELVIVRAPGDSAPGSEDPPSTTERLSVKALRERVWLLREAGSGTREATDQLLLPHLRAYRRSIELGSSEAIKHAAIEGMVTACLSHWVVTDAIASGRLRRVPTTLPKMTRQCHLVVHRDKQPTAALLRFVEHAKASLQARDGKVFNGILR